MGVWYERSYPPLDHYELWDVSGTRVGSILFLIGGDSEAISAYDPEQDRWTSLPPLSSPSSSQGMSGCHIGSDIYWIDYAAETFRSINVETGIEGSHPSPGDVYDFGHLAASNGLVFAMGGDAPKSFNPSTNTWSDITPAPITLMLPNIAVDESSGLIYVSAFDGINMEMWFGAYDPVGDSWQVLEPPSTISLGSYGFALDGKVYFGGGINPMSSSSVSGFRIYDISNDSWSTEAFDIPIEDGMILWSDVLPYEGKPTIFSSVSDGYNNHGLFSYREEPFPEWDALPAPPNEHSDLDYAGMGSWGDDLLFVGGFGSTAISVYGSLSKSWNALPPLDIAAQVGLYRVVTIDDTAYWLDYGESALRARDLLSDNEALYPAPPFMSGGLEAVRGIIYSVESESMFDQNVGTWQSFPFGGTPGDTQIGTAADDEGGRLYVYTYDSVFESGWFGYYDTDTDTWESLNPNPVQPMSGVSGVVYNGKIYFAGGLDQYSNRTNSLWVYDIDSGIWERGGRLPFPEGSPHLAITSVVIPDGDEAALVTFGVNFSSYSGTLYSYPIEAAPIDLVEAFVDISVNIVLDIDTSEANLIIEFDVPGDDVVTADLLITFTTGRPIVEANAIITVNIPGEEALPAWPPESVSPGEPEGSDPIFPTNLPSSEAAPVFPQISGSDEYSFSWGVDSQLTGTAMIFGEEGIPTPEPDFVVEGSPTVSIEWGETPPTTRTHSWEAVTAELANSFELPELIPIPTEGVGGPDMILGDCLRPHMATLCGAADIQERCLSIELVNELMPTRLELAYAAATEAGLSLVILHGLSGLVSPTSQVRSDYRTEGKAPMQVIRDMLLGGGAYHWFAPGLIIVNGGGLPLGASLSRPALRGTGGSVNLVREVPFEEAEPQLEDYLADCQDTDSDPSDPCDGETFETAFSGTLSWVERGGSGLGYSEIHNTLVKSEGRIVREETTVYRMYWSLGRSPTNPFYSPGQGYSLVPTEWTIKEHTYLACCPQALSHTLERTWVSPSNRDPNATYENAYRVYLSSYKEIEQQWHAEGWLRSRLEATHIHHGWLWSLPGVTGGVELLPLYKTALRSETYVPIGRGVWHINTRVSDSILMSVSDDSGEPAGTHWGDVSNSYTVVTDAAPPQVTCEEPTDPCRDGDCEEQREEDFLLDYADWEALRDSWESNQSERISTSVTYNGRVTEFQPGDILPLGIITNISWSGAGPRTGGPSETTTIEFVGRAT